MFQKKNSLTKFLNKIDKYSFAWLIFLGLNFVKGLLFELILKGKGVLLNFHRASHIADSRTNGAITFL